MLICTKCGCVAEENSDYWEHHKLEYYSKEGTGPEPDMIEEWISCSECGSDDVVVAQKCAHCGEYFDPDTLVLVTVEFPPDDEYPDGSEDTKEVCPDCYEEHYFNEEDYT